MGRHKKCLHYEFMYIKTVSNLGHSYTWDMEQGELERGGCLGVLGCLQLQNVLVLALNSSYRGLSCL